MSWFRRKQPEDPLFAREKELQAKVTRLEREVGRLVRGVPYPIAAPPDSPRSSTRPYAAPVRPTVPPPVEPARGHYNEFGVAKFDLRATWQRWKAHWHGPSSHNPRMVKMLAAGSIQGLRTLRYERRVARNRFLILFVILLLILWGLGYTYLRNH